MSQIERPILLVLTIAGVVVTLFNFLILNQLSPLIAHLEKLDIRVSALEQTTNDISHQNTDLSQKLAVLSQFAKDTNARAVRIENVVNELLLNKAK